MIYKYIVVSLLLVISLASTAKNTSKSTTPIPSKQEIVPTNTDEQINPNDPDAEHVIDEDEDLE